MSAAKHMFPSATAAVPWLCYECGTLNHPPTLMLCSECGAQRTGYVGDGLVLVGPKVAKALRTVMRRPANQ